MIEMLMPGNPFKELIKRIQAEYEVPQKPIIFLPCSRSKPYSKSLTHCYLSAVTREEAFEKIVISDALGPVPYQFENDVPSYDVHPKWMASQMRRLIVGLLHHFLIRVQQAHDCVYYVGGRFHYEMLSEAVRGLEIKIISIIPQRGIRDYAESAEKLREIILNRNKEERK